MQVIRVVDKVPLVANAVLPESALPDAAFSFLDSSGGQSLARPDSRRKARFDVVPAGREICIVRRQCPDAVKVIRQYNDGVDRERTPPSRVDECRAQVVDVVGQQRSLAFQQRHGEKESATWNESADVMRHADRLRPQCPSGNQSRAGKRPAVWPRIPPPAKVDPSGKAGCACGFPALPSFKSSLPRPIRSLTDAGPILPEQTTVVTLQARRAQTQHRPGG